MSVAQVSPQSFQADPAQVNQKVQADKASTPAQTAQPAEKAIQATKTDTVTVSAAALQMATKTATTTLTGSALARSLKQQGMPVDQIALKMNLSPEVAARLLGIQVVKTAPQAKPATATAQPQQVASSPAEEAIETPAAKAQETLLGKV